MVPFGSLPGGRWEAAGTCGISWPECVVGFGMKSQLMNYLLSRIER